MRILESELFRFDVHTRMPFRYGIATLTEAPHVFLRVHLEVGGKTATGISADHLPPKWFTKDPDRPTSDEIDEMARVVRHAMRLAENAEAASVFELWQQLYAAQMDWALIEKLPPLLAHFGVTLVERATIDAVCRASGEPFWKMLHSGRLGVRLSAVHPGLRDDELASLLPAKPLDRLIARHTVGLTDALTEDEIPHGEHLDDGLPQSLEACIRHYGLRHFKIKVCGQPEHDVERLMRVARIVAANAPGDYGFTLDGNESFRSAAPFAEFWRDVTARVPEFFRHLIFVEQPFHRDLALDDSIGEFFAQWPDRPPVIIDESDATTASLPRALALGYAGTSHKNCKGVCKSVCNAALLERLRQSGSGLGAAKGRGTEAPPTFGTEAPPTFVMSGEDLTNIGPVALLQDLAVAAALGIESVERNGHHYFAGLSMFPKNVQRTVLGAHGDLYAETSRGWPAVAIRDGMLAIESLNRAPFGTGFEMDLDFAKKF